MLTGNCPFQARSDFVKVYTKRIRLYSAMNRTTLEIIGPWFAGLVENLVELDGVSGARYEKISPIPEFCSSQRDFWLTVNTYKSFSRNLFPGSFISHWAFGRSDQTSFFHVCRSHLRLTFNLCFTCRWRKRIWSASWRKTCRITADSAAVLKSWTNCRARLPAKSRGSSCETCMWIKARGTYEQSTWVSYRVYLNCVFVGNVILWKR